MYANPMLYIGSGLILHIGQGPIHSIGPNLFGTSCKWSNPWHRTRSYVGCWTSFYIWICIMLFTFDKKKFKIINSLEKILMLSTCQLHKTIYCTINPLYDLIRVFPLCLSIYCCDCSVFSQHLHTCYLLIISIIF